MALNNFFDIPKWESTELDPDAAGVVAMDAPEPSVRATHIVVASDGEVEFRDEVTLQAVRSRHLDLSLSSQASKRPPQLPNTIEIRCRISKCSMNQSIVMAAYPYGFDWFAVSRLKPSRFLGRRRDAFATQAALALIRDLGTADDPQSVLEAAAFDPFETGDEYLTARFVGPFQRTEGGHVTIRTRRQDGHNADIADVRLSSLNKVPKWSISKAELLALLTTQFAVPGDAPVPEALLEYLGIESSKGGGRRTVSPCWLWGLCDDFEKCCDRLRNCEKARQWVSDPEAMLSDTNFLGNPPAYKLKDEAVELFSQLAEPFLESSIIKALAGTSPAIPDFWEYADRRLAIELVFKIFRRSMLNLAKRLGGERATKINPLDYDSGITQVSSTSVETSFDVSTTAEDQEKIWQEKFAGKALNPAQQKKLFLTVCELLSSGNDSAIIEACGSVAAASATMAVPVEVTMLLSQIAKDKSNDLTARGATYALQVIRKNKSGECN